MTEEKKKNTTSRVDRLLQALEKIYTNPNASIPEQMQAVRLSVEVLPFRRVPRHKTDLERAKIAALEKATGKTVRQKKKAPAQGTEA